MALKLIYMLVAYIEKVSPKFESSSPITTYNIGEDIAYLGQNS